MIKKVCITLIIMLLISIAMPVLALASDITGAIFFGNVIITNNSTATTNSSTNMTLNTQSMIDGGYINSTCNNTAIRNESGIDVAYMPAPGATDQWMIWVDSIGALSQLGYTLYTGGSSMNSTIRYFPGTGGMTASDNASLELSDNFTIEQSGWIDTDSGTDKNLVYKEDAFIAKVTDTGEISAGIWVAAPVVYNADAASTDLTINDAVYVTARNEPVADSAADDTNTGQNIAAGFNIWRTAVVVDTSALPDSAVIISANLLLTSLGDNSPQDFDVVIQNGMPTYPHNPVVVADFDRTFYSGDGGSLTTVGWVAIGLNTIPLNNTGLGWINKTGETKFMLRSSRDISATPPAGDEYVQLDSSATQLQIYYTDPTVVAAGISSGEHVSLVEEIDNTGAGWLAGWDNRIQIDIDADDVDSDLTYFPLLLYLSVSSGIGNDDLSIVFDELGANSLKLAITEDDGTTELFVEVAGWDAGAEEAWLWVSNAAWVIDDTVDTTVYLYYDNDHADNNAQVGIPNSVPAETVWNGDFVFVTHMIDDPNNASIRDSTSINNDGAKTGANEPLEVDAAATFAGVAQQFDGGDDAIDLGNHVSLSPADISVLVWAKSATLKDQGLIGKWGGGANLAFEIHLNAAGSVKFGLRSATGGNDVTTSDIGYEDDVWRLYSMTWDSTILRPYINTTPQATNGDNPGAMKVIANNVFIGKEERNARFFDGTIGIVKIADVALPAQWIKATYESETDDFVDYVAHDAIALPEYSIDFQISIDGTLEDRVLGDSVPDNANDWAFLENNSMSYMEYHQITTGDTLVQDIAWENSTTSFTDQSGNGNPTIPTFRTASSDPDLSAALDGFQPVNESQAPSFILGATVPTIGSTPNITGNFTTVPQTGTFPLAEVIKDIADATSTPQQLPLLFIATFAILALSLSTSAVFRQRGSGSLIVKIIVIAAIMGIFIALRNFGFDMWMLIVFLILGISFAMGSRQLGWS